MNLLFKEWNNIAPESKELNIAIEQLCDLDSDTEICSEKQEILLNCVIEEKYIAFRAGFRCATELMK